MTAPELPSDISTTVSFALNEDIATGDITADLIAADTEIEARIISRAHGVLCGIPWATEVFHQLDPRLEVRWVLAEGDTLSPDALIAELRGNARAILTGERTALNFLQTLSGTATTSRRYASLIDGSGLKILDTRKTLPGLRTAQKYAVAIGGCHNHRMGLFDAFLIKENHINACGGIAAAITQARKLHPGKPVEIEVENLEQLEAANEAGADIVMLDNFELEQVEAAVAANRGRARLEVSGGVTGEALVKIAGTGVDYVSIGALTKSCDAIDLSLLVD